MNISKIIATVFGLGYLPLAPGTFGAIFGLIVSYILSNTLSNWLHFQYIHLFLILASYFLGVYACKLLEKEWGHDPSKVVLDETCGYWISILFLPINAYILIAGFVLFRFFDIIKPLGIRKIDQMHSHHSVMLDDVLAGIYSNFVLQAYVYFYF